MSYKSYEDYKDSGVEWIGEIPKNWKISSIKELYQYRSEKVTDKVFKPLSVTKQGIVPQLENAAKTDNNDNRKKVKKGDFVINSRSDRKGSCGVSNYEGSVSLIYHVLEPNFSYFIKYGHHLFRSMMFAEEFYKWGHGIVDDLWSTQYNEMKKIKIPHPSSEECILISKFLDKETNEINQNIDKNNELISLLEEKKVALINETLIKGCSSKKFITFQIDILNQEFEVSENNQLLKLGYLLKTKITDGPHETPEFIDEGYPFLSVDSIVDGKLNFEGCRYISEEDFNKYKLKCNPQRDDVFMGKAASIGKVAIVDVDLEFSIWSPLALLRPDKEKILPKFLEYSLKAQYVQDQVDLFATSNTQKNISMGDIPRIQIFVPSLSSQIKIIEYLEKKIYNLNMSINQIQQQNELLEEYKQSLIHHAVTGKIDVREVEV